MRKRAVPADQPVPTERPDISWLGDGRFLQLGFYIKIVVLDSVLQAVLEEVINLGRLETSEGHIEIRALQIGDEQSQLFLVPFAGNFVEGDVESLFLIFGKFHHNTVHLGDAHID